VPPSSGEATVLGLDVIGDAAAIRARVGYLPEHDCLPPDVSASDFVVHLGMMSGLPRVAARERAAEVLRHVGLAEERYRPMGGYSTGMKQKAKLAQALAHDPRLVLLDEPTNGLDVMAVRNLRKLLGTLRDAGHCVLFSSHVMQEVEQLCDEVVVIAGGQVVAAGAIADIRARAGNQQLEDAFVQLLDDGGAAP
jgi:ABC-2 type transport system ATP-binding protein